MNRHRMTVAALAAVLFLAAPLAAQTQDPRESPYRLSWARDGAIFAAAGAGVGIADFVTAEHDPLTETELVRFDRNDVLWFDRPATHRFDTDLIRLSEQIGTPLALAPFALLLDSRIRADWQVLGVMYVQTTMLSAATSTIAKESIRRYRPYVYNTDLTYEQRTQREPGKAFFSSAATSAFAHAVLLATVFGDHHPDSALKPVVWGGALAAAGTVSYLRFASGIHYPSDVLVGAAVGAGIGHLVPRLHRTGDRAFTVVPSARPEGAGLAIRIDF
jgi:membrane-associated phospholipid phosphatase